MADPKDPKQDDHIEDLLGQLQGIFGRLSKSEQEEADQKEDVPPPAPVRATTPAPPPIVDPIPEPITPPIPAIEPEPEPVIPVVDMAPPPPPPPPPPEPVPEPPPVATPEPAASTASNYQSTIEPASADAGLLNTAIFFPQGRETEGKTLAGKIETMTPKFAKVAFKLRVGHFAEFDPKSDWKESVLAQTLKSGSRALFIVMNSPLDDARRKAIIAELEPRGIYFQEVPLLSIEKKAFYMDLLLGIVFFFDSLKPGGQ